MCGQRRKAPELTSRVPRAALRSEQGEPPSPEYLRHQEAATWPLGGEGPQESCGASPSWLLSWPSRPGHHPQV